MMLRLPHNVDAEIAVLGAIIVDPVAAERCIPLLSAEHFFVVAHRRLFEAVVARRTAGQAADAIALADIVESDALIIQAGGRALLNQVVECATTPINAVEYAHLLLDLHRRRDLIDVAEDMNAWAHDCGTDLDAAAITELAKTRLAGLNGIGSHAGPVIPYTTFADARPVLEGLWLVKGVLPRRGVAVIYGPSGEGKTFVALDLLIHIARGEVWRGRKTTRTGVLYLAPDGGSVIGNRIEAYRRHHRVDAADLFVVSCPVDLLGKMSVGDLRKVEQLISHIERTHGVRIGAIVVDTVSRAMPGGDENQPADMSRFVHNLGLLSVAGERLAIGIHHTPKNDGTVLRGHSSLDGAADCELNVVDRSVRIAKQRDGADDLQFGFHLEVVEIGYDEDGETVTSCVAVASDVATASTNRDAAPKGAAGVALRLLHNAVVDAGEVPPASNHIPPNILAVGMDLWRRYCDAGQVSDGDTPDAKRKAFKRAATKLQEIGAIGVWGNWVWPADNRP